MLGKDMGGNDDKNEGPDRPVNQSYGEISRSTFNVGLPFLPALVQAKRPNSGGMQ